MNFLLLRHFSFFIIIVYIMAFCVVVPFHHYSHNTKNHDRSERYLIGHSCAQAESHTEHATNSHQSSSDNHKHSSDECSICYVFSLAKNVLTSSTAFVCILTLKQYTPVLGIVTYHEFFQNLYHKRAPPFYPYHV